MPKVRTKAKPHKGLLKRVRLTKNGKVKFQRAGGRHLRSNKTGDQIRKLRRPGYLCDIDVWRTTALFAGMLPHRGATPRKAEATEGKSTKKPSASKKD